VPHTLSPDSVTIGGEPVAFERGAPAVHEVTAFRSTAAAYVERLRAQRRNRSSKTLRVLVTARSGDLVVHIPVASELQSSPCDEGSSSSAVRPRDVRSATTGSTGGVPGSQRRHKLCDGAITLRVDASFLSTAALPIVIDR